MLNLNNGLVGIVSFHGSLLAATVIFVIPFLLYFSYRRIRPKFQVKVECWFCGAKNTVPYGNRNCWDCLSCDQYNGFKNDGDYNKPIPAQYDENLNFPIMGTNLKRKKIRSWSNGLCTQCNSNQVVKMKLLSAFVPVNAEKEDEEYQNYIHHLDKLYCLCWHCDIHTQKYLAKQDSILRNTLPLDFTSHTGDIDPVPVKKSFTLPKATYVFMIASLLSLVPLFLQSLCELPETRKNNILKIFDPIVACLPQSQISLFIGFISTTSVVGLIGKDRWQLNDALLTLFWVTLQVLYSNELLPETYLRKYIIYAQPAMVLFICVFSCVTYFIKIRQLSKNNRNRITTFKLKKPEWSTSSINSNFPSTLDDSFSTDEDSVPDPLSPLDVSFNAVHITPPHEKKFPYRGDIGYEFEISHLMKNSYPVVRPARFNPKSVTHSSWVAGGFWSLPSAYDFKIAPHEKMAMNYAMAGYQSSGLFTPPPSVTGSQESRATSAAGSFCNGDWQSSSAASVRSWPPSFYSERVAENSYQTQLRQRSPSQISQTSSVHSVATMTAATNNSWTTKKLLKFLIAFSVGCSVLGNVVFVNYYLNWPITLQKIFYSFEIA